MVPDDEAINNVPSDIMTEAKKAVSKSQLGAGFHD